MAHNIVKLTNCEDFRVLLKRGEYHANIHSLTRVIKALYAGNRASITRIKGGLT